MSEVQEISDAMSSTFSNGIDDAELEAELEEKMELLEQTQAAATAAQLALARGGEKTFMRLLLSTGRD